MEPPPFFEEPQLVHFDDPERFAGIGRAHVVILPKGRPRLLVTDPNQNLSASRALDMNVRRLMFARRRVDVDAERPFLVYLDHGGS
jgi:hypothetical protein